MSAAIVFAVYGSAAVVALFLLYFLRAAHWYWHVLSLALALAIGLVPIPQAWQVPRIDLAVGGVFLFLFLWGICAPLFPDHHGSQHPKAHHT